MRKSNPSGAGATRRRFLQAAGVAIAAPWVVPAAAIGRQGVPPSERIVLGMIGSGQRASQLSSQLVKMADARIAAVCDPNRHNREELKKFVEKSYAADREAGKYKGCSDYNDFRDLVARADLDAVFIAAPEHWHCLTALAAAKAGKDIYCEKAMTRTVAEGQALVKAVRQHKRIFQVGQQQRSDPIFALACQLVHDGSIGKLQTIKVGVPGNRTGPAVKPQPVPEWLDWDLWVGPAPLAPFQPERLVNMVWMSTYDYVIGYQAGWGAHNLDIAQWGNRADDTGPVEVQSEGVFPTEGICNCPVRFETRYRYANGVEMIYASEDKVPMGIRFEGTDARVYVNRNRIECGPDSFKPVLKSRLPKDYKPGYHDGGFEHLQNFLECVRLRKDPVATVEIGHRTNTVCHMSDIATRLKRKLRWDPREEKFIGDDEANRMLSRPMRAPWSV